MASVTSATWNSSKQIKRKRRAIQVLQFAVHFAHELVEVQPRLARQRHRLEKAVHQEALAAADAAPHVDAARDRRAHQQFGHRVGAPRLVVGPLVLAALERVERAQLGGVARVATLDERGCVERSDAHLRS
jgi:hypothetical protein